MTLLGTCTKIAADIKGFNRWLLPSVRIDDGKAARSCEAVKVWYDFHIVLECWFQMLRGATNSSLYVLFKLAAYL